MTRVGRPKKEHRDEALTRHVGTRFTQGERLALEERAAAAGLTVSGYVRAAALGLPLRRKQAPSPAGVLSPDELTALNRIGVNLNQLTRHLNAGLDGDVSDEVRIALRDLDALWARLLP